MKGCNVIVIAVLLVLLLVPAAMSARHIARPHSRHVRHLRSSSALPKSTTTTTAATNDHQGAHVAARQFFRKGPDTLQVAGSSLPDCSHACGSCTPCRLVMEALKAFWHAAFPDVALSGLISEQWKELGWQGPNPSTDFRSCGVIALENLIFFARTYPASFQRLLFKQGGRRATWEYPFAVAGINISFMLIQLLDLWSGLSQVQSAS
ncbi:hypothetical protein ACLB2K_058302 [Fragaria x ananassa]